MESFDGMHAFCHYGHKGQDGDRFGRLFDLPPLYTPPESLRALGQQGGPMDGGAASNRTNTVPVGQVFFGQFIDHDITLDVTSSLSTVNIASDTPNVRTPTLDLDCIYGAGPEASPFLFHATGDFARIKLLTGADGTAANQTATLAEDDLWRAPDGTAVIGDPRNDENRIISQLQLAIIRFHNSVCDTLHGAGVEGEHLYEEARRTVTWHYQWIVIEDFVRAMCGGAVVDDLLGNGRRFYCPYGETPFIPIEFAVAAYRFGHSMVPQRIQIQKGGSSFEVFGATLGRGFSPLSDADAVVDWHELVPTDENRSVQQAERLDSLLATDLLALPFIDPDEAEASLATRNLLRGQSFLLPSGEQVAAALGRDEDEIETVVDSAHDAAGDDVDLSSGVPLWYYLLKEAEHIGRETKPGQFDPGEGLGPVGARIVAETLVGLMEGDHRSYLASNRSWDPMDGVGVRTLGEMLTYAPALVTA